MQCFFFSFLQMWPLIWCYKNHKSSLSWKIQFSLRHSDPAIVVADVLGEALGEAQLVVGPEVWGLLDVASACKL